MLAPSISSILHSMGSVCRRAIVELRLLLGAATFIAVIIVALIVAIFSVVEGAPPPAPRCGRPQWHCVCFRGRLIPSAVATRRWGATVAATSGRRRMLISVAAPMMPVMASRAHPSGTASARRLDASKAVPAAPAEAAANPVNLYNVDLKL